MKILVYSDNHWCQYSSILRTQGQKYSLRLENQIESINWAEELAEFLGCTHIVHCGDFFDKESLNSVEITALNELHFTDKCHHFMLVGNHEMGVNSLQYSSMHLFGLLPKFEIISKPQIIVENCALELAFLPYILEENRKPLSEIFPKSDRKRIIFSHNDIAGIQLGNFITKAGFSIEEIEDNCNLFINGHLHNGGKISDHIYNVGNLTGQNFSEDGFKYYHSAFVIDTDTLRIDVYDNPNAINFYKVDITDDMTCDDVSKLIYKMQNAVVTVKCSHERYDAMKYLFDEPYILETRFVLSHSDNAKVSEMKYEQDLSVDHIKEFNNYILETIGNSDIVREELSEVLS